MDRQFPELNSAIDYSPEGGEPTYIPSSESVGAGHEDSMNRMPPITNGEFPNEESGEGKAP